MYRKSKSYEFQNNPPWFDWWQVPLTCFTNTISQWILTRANNSLHNSRPPTDIAAPNWSHFSVPEDFDQWKDLPDLHITITERNNILGKTNSLYIIKKFDWFIHETFFSYSDIFFIRLIDKIRERKTFPWFRILIIWNDKGQYASSASSISGITYGAFSFGEHQTVQTVKAKRKNSSADLERDADSILSFPLEKKRDKNQQSGHQSTTKTTTRLSLETGRLKTF